MVYLPIPDWLFLEVAKSTFGEVYPEIRAIAVGYTASKEFILRYYLDRKPIDYDYESLGEVMAYSLTALVDEKVNSIKEEAIYSTASQHDLDPLSGFIYGRKE